MAASAAPSRAPIPSVAGAPSSPPSASASPTPLPKGLEYHALVQQKVGFYAALLPPDYEQAVQHGKRFPIVVILHGSGSTELKHGSLAAPLGREGVIYVLPRAPHAHEETFTESKEPGWTAWPTYPKPWGDYESPTFPKQEVDAIDVARLYVDWIRNCVEDARKRYRTNGGRVVVIGHSQGAAFAHSFAIAYPDLVKAYFAYAGYYDRTPTGLDAAAALKSGKVTPFIAHQEADTVVKVERARSLIDYFQKNGVQYTSLILPGGDHRMSDRVKDEARRFVDKHACRIAGAPCSP